MFGKKKTQAGPAREVPLEAVEPGALHLFAAAIYGLTEGFAAEYRKPFDEVLAAVNAEFQRRALRRGAPITVQFSERLPALEIEALSGGFRSIAAGLLPSEDMLATARAAGDIAALRMVTAAAELATKVAAAVLECRVAVG